MDKNSARIKYIVTNMWPFWRMQKIFIFSLLIVATNGNHFLRGCQDIDPRCALVDEMKAAGRKFIRI